MEASKGREVAEPEHAEPDYLDEVFGSGGALARTVPGYEPREGQLVLARAIDRGMREGRAVLAEAPCGTGKSFAYGVPAAYHAARRGLRVLVATHNIALQEQLAHRDLPRLAAALPWRFSFALLKGRANYLCLDRLATDAPRSKESANARLIREWARTTTTGDPVELPFRPAPKLWARFSTGPDECKREGCPFRRDCFAERARTEAAAADIVVTNYHLLFAHLAVRRATGRDLVLPPADAIVCDEAHEAADAAREAFGLTFGPSRLARLAQQAAMVGLEAEAHRALERCNEVLQAAAAHAASRAYQGLLQAPGFTDPAAALDALRTLARAARALDGPDEDPGTRALARNTARAAREAARDLDEAVAQSDANKAYWIERDRRGRATLRGRPVAVGGMLRRILFGLGRSVTLTSATLSTSGHFGFVRRELGVPSGAIEVRVESPFDFAQQALLVVPRGLPEPGRAGFVDAAARALQSVVDQCDGRTLALFASHRNLAQVHARLAAAGQRHRLLRQGELPRAELARIFAEDVHSVLLGTDSFRTGFDVPGEALTGLVIDKLPFPPPSDPVVRALRARGARAFWDYVLPRALIALRQSVGRLIRARTDVGVVAILDGRLRVRRYGAAVRASLPPMPVVSDLRAIGPFLARVAARARFDDLPASHQSAASKMKSRNQWTTH